MANSLQIAVRSEAAVTGLRKYDTASKKSETQTKKFAKSVDNLERNLDRTGSTAATAAKLIGGLFAGISAVTVIRSAVQAMTTFEETLAVVRGVTGATAAEFAVLEQAAKDLGATTRFSATQAGEGLLFLARAGFTVEEAIAAIPETLKFAQAAMLDLGTAADIVSNILTQFGLAAEETARAGNILVNTANSANTNVQQLAEAMKFAGPIAGALGRTLEETAAAIGVLGDSGIQASMAGTGLRQIMIGLSAPTAKARDIFKALGITLEEMDPTINSLTDIFGKLKKANLDVASATGIFGRRAAASALILSRNTERVRELTQANEDAVTVLDDMAALMDDTLRGAFLSLKSAIEATFLSVGDAGLLGGLKDLTQASADAVRITLGLEEQIDNVTTSARVLATAIELVIAAIQAMILIGAASALIKLGAAFQASSVVATLMAKRVFIVNTAMKTTAVSTGILGRAIRALTLIARANPLLLIGAGITAAIFAFSRFNQETPEVVQSAEDISNSYARITDSLEGMKEAQVAFNNALDSNNLSQQISALKEQAEILEKTKRITVEAAVKPVDRRSELEVFLRAIEDRKAGITPERRERFRQSELRGNSTITPGRDLGPAFQPLIDERTQQISKVTKAAETLIAVEVKGAEITGDIAEIRVQQDKARIAGLKKLNLIEVKANKRLDDQLSLLKFQQELIGKTNLEREQAIALRRAENIASKAGIELLESRRVELSAVIAESHKLQELVDIGNAVGDSFANAFLDMVTGAASAADAIKSLGQEIARLVLQKTITDPLSTAIAGFATNIASTLFTPGGAGLAGGAGDASGLSPFDFGGRGGQGNLRMELTINSPQPLDVASITSSIDGRQAISNVFVDDINNGGPISRSLRNA